MQKKLQLKWIWLILAVVLLAAFIFNRQPVPQAPTENITYSAFSEKLDQPGEIVLVTIKENADQTSGIIAKIKLKDGKDYDVNFPLYLHPGLSEKLDQLEESGAVDVRVEPVKQSSFFSWLTLLLLLLPLLLIFFLVRRGLKQQVNSVKSLAKNNDKMAKAQVKERFSDVAGIDEAKEELDDIVDFLRNHQKYQGLGARIPRGVLLFGPPGTGKTLLARAIAGEADVPFFSVSGSEFVEMFVGLGAARVRDLFEQARKSAPSIVFIDEIDAVGRRRGSGLGQGHDEREQTLNQIFVEMDGFDERTSVIVIAATNRPDILDPALLRPKRFDRKVAVGKPDVRGREAILKIHTRGKPLADDVNLGKIAQILPGVSGADLENLTNEAAIIAVKREKSIIDNSCFLAAIDKILMGKEKKLIMDDKDKELIAFHESGHALVAKMVGTDPVRKISITAREGSLGQTLVMPEKDRYIISEEYLLKSIQVILGGRLAEEIFLHTKSTGAEDDLRKATDVVQKMVCSWGMSKLGPRAFGVKEEEIFLGREITRKEDVGPEILKAIDDEVARIITSEYETAKGIILKNQEKMKKLVEALLEKETLEQEEINNLLKES